MCIFVAHTTYVIMIDICHISYIIHINDIVYICIYIWVMYWDIFWVT